MSRVRVLIGVTGIVITTGSVWLSYQSVSGWGWLLFAGLLLAILSISKEIQIG